MESERSCLKAAADKLASARGEESTLLKQFEEHLQARCGADDLEMVKREAFRLSAEVASADEVLDAKRLVIAKDNEHIRQSGELIKELEIRQQEALPWQKLNSLIGSADGAKFRNIAQQWTLEILIKHANAQLNLLSGRYRLERLRDSLNLVITDLEMGWQRSVHSLSGGESFLVSLGLALGLASLTSSRLLIESLFIDEGFGSLDSETLRVALNALSHLESQGRKVGVISHVSEMVDAIPVQVRVVRVSGGASRIVI
jgi:exonuclease SbcC